MAGRKAPSFLKRQKEQQRMARAEAKRLAKQERRANRAAGASAEEVFEPIDPDAAPAPPSADEDDTAR